MPTSFVCTQCAQYRTITCAFVEICICLLLHSSCRNVNPTCWVALVAQLVERSPRMPRLQSVVDSNPTQGSCWKKRVASGYALPWPRYDTWQCLLYSVDVYVFPLSSSRGSRRTYSATVWWRQLHRPVSSATAETWTLRWRVNYLARRGRERRQRGVGERNRRDWLKSTYAYIFFAKWTNDTGLERMGWKPVNDKVLLCILKYKLLANAGP